MPDVRVTTTEDSVTGDSEVVGVSIVTVDGVAAGGGGGGGGTGAVDSVNGHTGVVVLAASDVGAQPSDSDLTAIAALSTTTFGRGLLALVDAPALRAAAGLGTAATQASTAFDPAGAAAAAQTAAQAASQPLDSDLTAIAALATTTFGRSLLTAADAAAARTLIGAGTSSLALGTSSSTAKAGDYQPAAANITDASAIGRAILTAADAAAVRAAIGAGTSSFDGTYAALTGKPTLGTAAPLDVPASGDAASGQVVKGTDSRLSDARTPTAHTHPASQVSDSTTTGRAVMTAADAAAARTAIGAGTSSLALGTTGTTAAAGNDSRLSDARTPTAHAASHAAAGSDPLTLTEAQVTGLVTDLAAKAPLASPAFTGHPTGVTEAAADNSTRLASTAYADRGDGLLIPKSLVTTKGDLIVGTGAGAVTRRGVGADGTVLTADSTQTDGVKWAAGGGGGGGLAAGYLGKNAIGGSWFTLATQGTFKKITTTGAAQLLSVEAYLRMAADGVSALGVALFSDSAGTPSRLLATNGHLTFSDVFLLDASSGEVGSSGVGRWYATPLAYQLAAATSYWVGLFSNDYSSFDLAYDTSGSDRTWTSGGTWLADWGRYSAVTTTRDHSIRANVLA